MVRENKNGEKYLCAYFVPGTSGIPGESDLFDPGSQTLDAAAFRDILSRSLPDYMIPAYFVEMEHIPLTPIGKVDRRALPQPGITPSGEYLPPTNETEKKLVEIWSEVLGIKEESIGIQADFFQLGGHSLKAAVAVSKISKEFNIEVPMVELFTSPTIQSVARYIDSSIGIAAAHDNNLVLLKPGTESAPHLFLVHDGTGEVEGYIEFCKHLSLSHEFHCWGLRANRLENTAPQNQNIRELSQQYIEKIKKVQPPGQGPYYIAGWSLGGTIAYEMVWQLEQLGENIALLALIDSPSPRKDAIKNATPFNLESELNHVHRYFPGNKEITERCKHVKDLNKIWSVMVDFLEEKNVDTDLIKRAITEYGVDALPNYDSLGIKESIYYLNVARTFINARARYIPGGKINTQVHCFIASQSKEVIQNQWEKYCRKSIKYHTISGDHFSIFKMPDVVEFTKEFAKVLNLVEREIGDNRNGLLTATRGKDKMTKA